MVTNSTINIKPCSYKALKGYIVQEKQLSGKNQNIAECLYTHLTFDFFGAYKNTLTEVWVKLSVYLPLTCSLLQNIPSTPAISL